MPTSTGASSHPSRPNRPRALVKAEELWHRLEHYVRSQLVWGNVYRTTSYLRSSLWFVPFIAIVLVLAVVPVLRWLDAALAWRIIGLTNSGAESLYQSVITLTLSFLVFTFGSLLVAIQVASGQLTPRIIATTLLRNNVVRFSVGLFVFTLLFAIGTVARIETNVPHLVMWVSAILGLGSLMAFLFFDRLCGAVVASCHYRVACW